MACAWVGLQWNGERVRQDLNLPGKDWSKEVVKSPEDGEEYKPWSCHRR